MRKQEQVISRILREGEKRYIREVLRPTLADLKEARKQLKASMPKGRGADAVKVQAVKAQLERIGEVEARVKQHLEKTKGRFTAAGRA